MKLKKFLSNINIDTPAGYRNRAILELLWASGMRVSELSGLNFGNLNLENNEITVFGKGAKERIILVTDRAKNYLQGYIDFARSLVAKDYNLEPITDTTPVFINKTGYRLQTRMIRNVINEIVEKSNCRKGYPAHVSA